MKKNSLLFLISAVLILIAAMPDILTAQETLDFREERGILFLNTDPIGANVILNDSPLTETTPILLQDLDPGTYTIELRKMGYKPISETLDIEIGTPVIRNPKLEYDFFKPLLLDEESIVFNGEILENIDSGMRLDTGSYAFRRKGGTLFIDPIYPKQGLITALNISLPIVAALSGILTINDILKPQSTGFNLSPSVYLSWGVTLSITAADLFLLGDKHSYMNDVKAEILEEGSSSFEAKEYYERGERMLSMGNMEEALEFYSRLLDTFPESPLLPYALYKIAKIHQITGETTMAALEMELILNTYPVPELYDKTCQNLAVLYFRNNEFEKSLTYLDAMVFVDPLFSREEVALYGSDILKVWSESSQPEEIE